METAAPLTQAARQRISNACEACRSAKLKCQPSSQAGICRRCHENKKECVFRALPRTRRPRQSKICQDAERPPPPPGPSKTFTIDFPVAAPDPPSNNVEGLASRHHQYVADFMNGEADGSIAGAGLQPGPGDQMPLSPPASASSPAPPARSAQSIGLQPQFNLESAEGLLQSFRSMLDHFPCIVLPVDATVASLAKRTPFVLLAILAATSGGKTLQGHSLYDEELRKILGLKFVAAGERSLELLQGLLIYTAWYPFHLRAKNKQSFQYIKMLADVIRDLELDQSPRGGAPPEGDVERAELEKIRAYLAGYYLTSVFAAAWHKMSLAALPYTNWTSTCTAILEQNAECDGDLVLCWLARLGNIIKEVADLCHGRRGAEQAERQTWLMVMGLESQLRNWQGRISPQIASNNALFLTGAFAEVFINSAPLFRLSSFRKGGEPRSGIPPDPGRLQRCMAPLRRLLDHITGLSAADFALFSSIDWVRFILSIIIGVRISFPIADCPGWDSEKARAELRFDEYLEKICDDGEGGGLDEPPSSSRKATDVLSATRVVIRVVKYRYDQRVEQLETLATKDQPRKTSGCPMMDARLEHHLPLWDETLANPYAGALFGAEGNAFGTGAGSQSGTAAGFGASMDMNMGPGTGNGTGSGFWTGPGAPAGNPQPVLFHDLWATMTMGWAESDGS